MPLQRGSYGIEFDERSGFPYQKFGWIIVAIPVVALGLLFFRGCPAKPEKAAPPADGSAPVARAAAQEGRKARPSLLTHFVQTVRNASAKDATQAAAKSAAPAQKEKWMASLPDDLVSTLGKPSDAVKQLLQQVTECEGADDALGARQALRKLMVRKDAEGLRGFAERKIGDINTTLIFANRAMPEKTKHRIEEGDLVVNLTKRYGNTQDYLLKVNGIERPDQLRLDREIWVLDHPAFELTVFRKSGSAVLMLDGFFFKRYAVKVGRPDDVPNGTYAVRSRTRKTVYRGSEDDTTSLNVAWLSLAATGDSSDVPGLGLHGTWSEASLGRQVNAGRIGFSNTDIDELYVLLPGGAQVYVTD
jgi:hypothetical protein